MVTYAQLEREQVYLDEVEPAGLEAFLIAIRAHYNLPASALGAKGNNSHLKGRHRSRNWCLTSAYCTNRGYATTDARDKKGDGDWIRAGDLSLHPADLYTACRRLDGAVRRGELPELAEWFGTFDGNVVVGWYQGHASSSDSSHLTHLHNGIWTEHANNGAFYGRLFAVITGTAPTTEGEAMRYTFADDLPGIPDGAKGRVHLTDGLRYRIVPSSFQVGDLLDAAGAGPVVAVTRAKLPAGWTYAQALAALCGTADPGEQSGGGSTPAPPIDLEAVKAAAFDGGKAGGTDGGKVGATAALTGARIGLTLSGSGTGTITPAG